MFAQIIEFKLPTPEQVERTLAENIGALTYNLNKLGVQFTTFSYTRFGFFALSMTAMWCGQALSAQAESRRSAAHALFRALETIHNTIMDQSLIGRRNG